MAQVTITVVGNTIVARELTVGDHPINGLDLANARIIDGKLNIAVPLVQEGETNICK